MLVLVVLGAYAIEISEQRDEGIERESRRKGCE